LVWNNWFPNKVSLKEGWFFLKEEGRKEDLKQIWKRAWEAFLGNLIKF